MADLDGRTVRRVLDHMCAHQVSQCGRLFKPGTVHRIWSVLRSALNEAHRRPYPPGTADAPGPTVAARFECSTERTLNRSPGLFGAPPDYAGLRQTSIHGTPGSTWDKTLLRRLRLHRSRANCRRARSQVLADAAQAALPVHFDRVDAFGEQPNFVEDRCHVMKR